MTTRAKQVLQVLQTGIAFSSNEIAVALDLTIDQARRTMDYLQEQKLIQVQPVAYKITDAGVVRLTAKRTRAPSKLKPVAVVVPAQASKVTPSVPNQRIVSLAMSSQPTLMRVWGVGA